MTVLGNPAQLEAQHTPSWKGVRGEVDGGLGPPPVSSTSQGRAGAEPPPQGLGWRQAASQPASPILRRPPAEEPEVGDRQGAGLDQVKVSRIEQIESVRRSCRLTGPRGRMSPPRRSSSTLRTGLPPLHVRHRVSAGGRRPEADKAGGRAICHASEPEAGGEWPAPGLEGGTGSRSGRF